MMLLAAVLILVGDLIIKKDGEAVDCIVVSQNKDNVVYRVPTGIRQVPMNIVASIEIRKTFTNRYEAAAFYVREGDSVSYYALARWCDENDLAAPSELLYRMASSEEKVVHLSYLGLALRTRDPLKKRSYLEFALCLQPDDRAIIKALAGGAGPGESFASGVYLALAELVEKFVSLDYGGTLGKIQELKSRRSPVEKGAVNLAMMKRLGFGLDELAERVDALSQQRAYLGGGKIRCPMCKGRKFVTCRACGGTGSRGCPKCGGSGAMGRGKVCPVCDGAGRANCSRCSQSKYGRSISVPLRGGSSKIILVHGTGKTLCKRCGKFLKGLPREVVEKAVPVTAAESKKLRNMAARMRDKAKGGFAYEWDAAQPLRQLRRLAPAGPKAETLVFAIGKWLTPRMKRLHARSGRNPPREDAEWFEAYVREALSSDLARAARKMTFDAEGLLAWEELFERWRWTRGAYYERRKLFSAVFTGKSYVPSPDGGIFVVGEGIVLRPEPALELPGEFGEVLLYFRVTDVERKTTWKDEFPSVSWEARIEPVYAMARREGKTIWSR